jgi:hypothetical protein
LSLKPTVIVRANDGCEFRLAAQEQADNPDVESADASADALAVYRLTVSVFTESRPFVGPRTAHEILGVVIALVASDFDHLRRRSLE